MFFFFSITSPGSSKNAREYLRKIENGMQDFELKPELLSSLSDGERIKAIWTFGTGKNAIKKHLGRFFSKPENLGDRRNLEYRLNQSFNALNGKGFIKWFEKIDELKNDRLKANELTFLPGIKLKVSRDFLNNMGMTDTLIPLDIHILSEMKKEWGWNVPKNTPSNQKKYEEIEDAVRKIADIINCKVVEIDKAIVSSRIDNKQLK